MRVKPRVRILSHPWGEHARYSPDEKPNLHRERENNHRRKPHPTHPPAPVLTVTSDSFFRSQCQEKKMICTRCCYYLGFQNKQLRHFAEVTHVSHPPNSQIKVHENRTKRNANEGSWAQRCRYDRWSLRQSCCWGRPQSTIDFTENWFSDLIFTWLCGWTKLIVLWYFASSQNSFYDIFAFIITVEDISRLKELYRGNKWGLLWTEGEGGVGE